MAKKTYKFACETNDYLYVGEIKAQFINGKFKTKNKEKAEYLREKLPYVREIK